MTLSVFDTSGKLIRREILPHQPGKAIFTLNRDGLNEGLYIYRIENRRGEYQTGRFVVTD